MMQFIGVMSQGGATIPQVALNWLMAKGAPPLSLLDLICVLLPMQAGNVGARHPPDRPGLALGQVCSHSQFRVMRRLIAGSPHSLLHVPLLSGRVLCHPVSAGWPILRVFM